MVKDNIKKNIDYKIGQEMIKKKALLEVRNINTNSSTSSVDFNDSESEES